MLTLDKITEIFFLADEYCHYFNQHIDDCMIKLDSDTTLKTRNKPCGLSQSEVITILICFHLSDYRTLKHFYLDYVCVHLCREFPHLVSYNRFVELQQKYALPMLMFVSAHSLGNCTGISFIDSTRLEVCAKERIHQNKVFSGAASRGYSTMGWFYGFKLHLVINDMGEIIAFQLTQGSVSDNNTDLLLTLCKKLFGKLYGDKGYLVKQSVFEHLFHSGVQLITKIKRNMKNKLMSISDKIMLRKRSVVECVNDALKNICQIEHSRHRSISGFIINLYSGIAAYSFLPKKPSIKTHFEFDHSKSLQLSL
ncbi:IS982 family transposase [Mucilaginibacter mali]|uniref:IS982 family transposase n=1 Tax=Mucilaginibacter mali TaxID=2740462 RepID=A0A7D4PWJ6_9SPHI|nr:IS982 family transposase [Mucilaginibacter mali]QKJ29474.1 IS982 family transposase [Mucilaginibacter mali]QKJ31823.1 IS982 family transposase [Mucilaginibacter mali]